MFEMPLSEILEAELGSALISAEVMELGPLLRFAESIGIPVMVCAEPSLRMRELSALIPVADDTLRSPCSSLSGLFAARA